LPLIKFDNVTGPILRYFKEKQDEWHEVRLTKKAYDILKTYKKFPLNSRGKPMPKQQMNKTIKELARRAKIKKIVEYAVLSGSHVHRVELEKWKVIGTHTARRTQATLMLRQTGNMDEVKEKLGHSSQKVTEIYIGTKFDKRDRKFEKDII
jgi:integrase